VEEEDEEDVVMQEVQFGQTKWIPTWREVNETWMQGRLFFPTFSDFRSGTMN
jgi:hypothetical protein